MKTSSIVIIVIAILVILGGWYAYATYYSPSSAPSTALTINSNPNGPDYNPNGTPGSTSSSTTTSTASSTSTATSSSVGASTTVKTSVSTAPMAATVTLTANGFTPKTVTIKKGGTVTWKNAGTGGMWVASAQHPTHTLYDGTSLSQHCPSGTSFDQCKSGTTYSFTFSKVGSWTYHNHSNPSQFGTVVVVE